MSVYIWGDGEEIFKCGTNLDSGWQRHRSCACAHTRMKQLDVQEPSLHAHSMHRAPCTGHRAPCCRREPLQDAEGLRKLPQQGEQAGAWQVPPLPTRRPWAFSSCSSAGLPRPPYKDSRGLVSVISSSLLSKISRNNVEFQCGNSFHAHLKRWGSL